MSARYWELVARFKELLDAEKIDVPTLRQLAWENGIPDEGNVRWYASSLYGDFRISINEP